MNQVSTIARDIYTNKLYTLLVTNALTGKVNDTWNKEKYIKNVLDGLEDEIILLSHKPEDIVVFNNDKLSLNPLTKNGEIPEIKLLWINALIETGAANNVEVIYETSIIENDGSKTIKWNILALPEKQLKFVKRRNIVAKDFVEDDNKDTNFKKNSKLYFNPQVKSVIESVEQELEVDKLEVEEIDFS